MEWMPVVGIAWVVAYGLILYLAFRYHDPLEESNREMLKLMKHD